MNLLVSVAQTGDPAEDIPHARPTLIAWQLNRLVNYIETHLSERIDTRELAAAINLSASHLFRAFKGSLGESPQRYIAKRRITLACEKMRHCAEPLAQIANVCGFCDQPHLCRTFRRLMGTTPAAWRRARKMSPPEC
jgi:AraC family transcriptional regulator